MYIISPTAGRPQELAGKEIEHNDAKGHQALVCLELHGVEHSLHERNSQVALWASADQRAWADTLR